MSTVNRQVFARIPPSVARDARLQRAADERKVLPRRNISTALCRRDAELAHRVLGRSCKK
jgi:hypothetical protein